MPDQSSILLDILNRRTVIEDALWAISSGKRAAFTRQEARELALRLGVPSAFHPRGMAPSREIPPLIFGYRNHRGEVAVRRVIPVSIRFGTSEWHAEPQWLLLAFDLDRAAEREFAIQGMRSGDLRRVGGPGRTSKADMEAAMGAVGDAFQAFNELPNWHRTGKTIELADALSSAITRASQLAGELPEAGGAND